MSQDIKDILKTEKSFDNTFEESKPEFPENFESENNEDCDDEEDFGIEQVESGFDEDLGSYVSKELLNGEYIVQIQISDYDYVEYEGEFVNGIREGLGIYYQINLIDGQIDFKYSGDFYDNLPNGKGIASWNENNLVMYSIEGDFVDGLPDPTQLSTVIVEYVATEKTPAVKKTMIVKVNHISFEKPDSTNPNTLLDIYWQGVFELTGLMNDQDGVNTNGIFDIHGNVLSITGGRRSKKIINKKKKQSKKRI
jgi:hypothetical protein